MAAYQTQAKAKVPISRHPLFPAMVALWFAALFGLGSLAIRPTLLESVVLALRIDLIIPAAVPPLGITARILLALILVVIGAGLGFVLARRIARVPAAKPQPARFSKGKAAREGSDSRDGDDFARLDQANAAQTAGPSSGTSSAMPMSGRRRALAMEEDYSREFHDHAPLPGGKPEILDLASLPLMSSEDEGDFAQPIFAGTPEPAQEQVFTPPPAVSTAPPASFDPWLRHQGAAAAQPQFAAPQAPVTPMLAPSFAASAAAEVQPEPVAANFHRPQFAASDSASAMVDAAAISPALLDVPAPFAPATAPHQAFAADQAFDAPVAAIAPLAVPTAVEAPQAVAVLGLVPRDAAEKLAQAPVESLGVVELAERLALAITRRRAGSGAALTPASVAPTLPRFTAPVLHADPELPVAASAAPELEPAPEPEPEAIAELAPPPAVALPSAASAALALPSAMRPLSFDDDDDDDALQSLVPPRSFSAPQPAAIVPPPAPAAFAPPIAEAGLEPVPASAEASALTAAEIQSVDADAEDDGFGSLLGMKPSLRQSFVRIEEPEDEQAPIEPVVVFPGQAVSPQSFQAAPFAQPAPLAAVAAAVETASSDGVRRFDSPTAGVTPIQAAAPAPRAVDAVETERALKAALATLQRMSGAA